MSLRTLQNQQALREIQRRQSRGVSIYDPTRRLQPPQAPPPRGRPIPAASREVPAQGQGGGSLLEDHLAYMQQKGAQQQAQQQQQDEGGSPFGRGLGFLINNPVTQAALKPLEILDYGRRAITLGMEEFAEGITGQELKATEGDERSNMEKLKDPTYGVGQLLGDLTGNKWADRTIGFLGDVAFDPLTYLTAGVGAVAGKGARASSLTVLRQAQEAAARSGDDALVKALGGAGEAGEATAQRLGMRGLGVANPEQAAAMQLRKGGIRLTTPLGGNQMSRPIPGTERLARGINEVVGSARGPIRKLPGAKALRATRNPNGYLGNDMGDALEKVITGEGSMSMDGALATVFLDDAMREVGSEWGGVAAQTLENTVAKMKKDGLDRTARIDLARRADAGEVNEWSTLADEMRLIAKELSGVDLPQLDGVYGMPHVLSRQFRNGLYDAAQRGDAGAEAFMNASGLTTQDLLEGSGFVQRRVIRPNADGTPLELELNGRKVDIETGTVEELNAKLPQLFPWFKGKHVYEVDPVLAYQRYISSMSRTVGIKGGGKRAADASFTHHVSNRTQAPGRFDPYGGSEEMFDADGNVINRVTTNEGGPVEDEFWRAKPDGEATKARDKEITSTQKDVLDNLETYSEGERAGIARELEALADEVIAPIKQARDDASWAQTQGRTRSRQLNDAYADNQADIIDLNTQIEALTNEISTLAKVRYGIERTAQQRAPRRQRQLLNDLQTRHQQATERVARLRGEYKTAKQLAAETDGTPSSISAARKQIEARVDLAQHDLGLARQKAERDFIGAYGPDAVIQGWAYRSAKKRLDAGKDWGGARGGDRGVVNLYEKRQGLIDRATEVPAQRKRQALRELEEFDAEIKRMRAPKSEPVAPPPLDSTTKRKITNSKKRSGKLRREEIPTAKATHRRLEARQFADNKAELDEIDKALRQLEDAVEAGGPETRLRDRVGRLKEAHQKKVSVRRIETQASLARVTDLEEEADRLDEFIRASNAPTPPRAHTDTSVPQPDLERMLKTQQSIEQASRAADRSYAPRIIESENEQLATRGRLGRIAAQADPEFEGIPLEEGMEAIRKRQAVNQAQDEAKFQRSQLEGEVAERDQLTGSMIESYKENLQDIEASRLEHERISSELEKGGATATNPKARTEKVAEKKPSKAALDRVADGESSPAIEQPLYSVVEDIRRLIQANPLADDELLVRVEAALAPLERRLAALTTEADIPARQTEAILKAAKKGELAPVMRSVLRDNWRELWTGGDVVISDELNRMFNNLQRIDNEPHRFMRALTTYTNFFKTYATLTPGFHIRNGMSAVFMNYAMGVPTGTQIEGLGMWRRFVSAPSPREFMVNASERERKAISAVLASGAGGRYFEAGVADVTQLSTRAQERLFSNWFTKVSQRFGQDAVEGPVRVSLALKALDDGGDVRGAMQLIERIQFDYSRTSAFDERAKRLIPFWTFMSRNLPMQITTMWTNPRTYARYNSFIRNFRGEDVEGTPDYFDATGAFPFADTKIAGLPVFMNPDFAHTQIHDEIAGIEGLLSGENVAGPLTSFNPFFTAPLEFATGQDFFTGRQYRETDLREAGLAEKPYEAIAALLGQTETTPGGKRVVSEKFMNAMRSINPVYDRAVRLAPQVTTGGNEEDAVVRQIESILRTMGAPMRTLSPQQQQRTMRSEQFDLRDQDAMRRALAAFDQ